MEPDWGDPDDPVWADPFDDFWHHELEWGDDTKENP
jgi:hypothetical protein